MHYKPYYVIKKDDDDDEEENCNGTMNGLVNPLKTA
jgi:hypothetical protein